MDAEVVTQTAHQLSWWGMVLSFVPLAACLWIFHWLRTPLARDLLVSSGRMAVQLFLVGLYLTFLFRWNHPAVTLGYIALMTAVANFSILRSSRLSLSMYLTTLPAFSLAVFAVLAWYTLLVFTPSPLYDARYMVPVAGMILGNAMGRVIITLERFYASLREDSEGYAALVVMGATRTEASMPYLRKAHRAGIGPSLANMATMGLVSLPGMMTGQILGGSSPLVAIQYQIAIILAIFVATELAATLCVLVSLKKGLDDYGYPDPSVLK